MAPTKKLKSPRKRPVQARSKRTVEWLLEAAARVFRSEGFGATTNRIARAAGVSVGSLYEYFPDKEALLLALAERHLAEAERGIDAVLADSKDSASWLADLQQAILASQRYPSQAISLVSDPRASSALRQRAEALRTRVMDALCERARAARQPEPEVRARVVFGLIGELTCQTTFEYASVQAQPRARKQTVQARLEAREPKLDAQTEAARQLLALAQLHLRS